MGKHTDLILVVGGLVVAYYLYTKYAASVSGQVSPTSPSYAAYS